MVADINLDQLRPIFPLKTLTMLALDQSTLGETAKRVAASMDIRIQPDPEPSRNLLRRSDHWNFIQIGVPSTGFIFGFEKERPTKPPTANGMQNVTIARSTISTSPGSLKPPRNSTTSSPNS